MVMRRMPAGGFWNVCCEVPGRPELAGLTRATAFHLLIVTQSQRCTGGQVPDVCIRKAIPP
jgi:hypothetical protein